MMMRRNASPCLFSHRHHYLVVLPHVAALDSHHLVDHIQTHRSFIELSLSSISHVHMYIRYLSHISCILSQVWVFTSISVSRGWVFSAFPSPRLLLVILILVWSFLASPIPSICICLFFLYTHSCLRFGFHCFPLSSHTHSLFDMMIAHMSGLCLFLSYSLFTSRSGLVLSSCCTPHLSMLYRREGCASLAL
jgi:hypothetical protein